ncbi:MAG: ATP-binding protein [Ruthenibacterium sp.]
MEKLSKIQEGLLNLDLPIGLVIVEASQKLPLICANDTFVNMLGYATKDELFAACNGSAWCFTSPLDLPRLMSYAATRIGTSTSYEITYRALCKDGTVIWVSQNSRHALDENGREIVFAYFTDITAQKQTEQALRESESRYAAAIKSANINIGEYDYATDCMTIFSKSLKANSQNNIVKHYTEHVVKNGRMSAESVQLLLDMIEKLKNGAKEVTADLWVRKNEKDKFWCERVRYTNAFDDANKPVRAYCVGRDITREKEAEKRYYDERAYREAVQKATMASINMNLTQNTILNYKSNFAEVTAHMKAAKSAQNYFDEVCSELTTCEMQTCHTHLFSCDALLQHFENGETTVANSFTRKIAGRIYWVKVTAHMMQKENGDVVAFLYSVDITNERIMKNIMNAIVDTDYDFLVVVDAAQNSAVRYSEKNLGNHYAYQSEKFEPETQNYVRRYICAEDAERVAAELMLQNILAQLETQVTYSIFYRMPNPQGGVWKKQLRFSYINRTMKSILMTRVDITAAVEEQEKRNTELVTAVTMAERANAAKSDFLSRISHELRTPMNAIMGMNQLALQRLNDPVFTGECIEKSQYSSRYLLQLLNDILDMSKIESGKVTLKKELIRCEPFLEAVSTIIQTQAADKGVRYFVTQSVDCKYGYIGDDVRLQQILVNILTNAVKFTPMGGSVHLDISPVRADATIAYICFTVHDTGIGIREEFLQDIFQPFAQEHSGTRSDYGGSGLGLAISKNLAELMGGDISVESTIGEGATFRVLIPLGIPQQDADTQENADITHEEYDFSGRNILLVEDHPINIMVAKKLLEFKNAQVTVAENGKIGLELFAAAPPHTFDAVLMDIRMPVMDGLESATHIRTLNSAWAKSVPIIAMSANAFEEDVGKSKQAGMDAHLAKPIDAELLYQTLRQVLQKSPSAAK